MSKTSEKQFRRSLKSAGLDKEQIDILTLNAQKANTVTTSSRGKLEALRTNFPEFNKICEELERFEAENKVAIDDLMIEEGFPLVAKISINIAK